MSKDKPLPSFRSIAPIDADDAALARVSDGLGVPTLVKTKPPSPPTSGVRPAVEKLTVELPGYLMEALRRAALDRHASVRHVVIKALAEAGFEVADADLVLDGRRTRARKP